MAAAETLYFQPSEDDLKILDDLPKLNLQLLSCLMHTLRQGTHLADPQCRIYINTASTSGSLCAKYVLKALKTDIDGDKLFALRKTGPSMKLVLEKLPRFPRFTTMGIFQLCIWRAFAFGHKDRLMASILPLSDEQPDFVALESLINSWGPGAQKIGVPAYGNFQFIKKEVSGMLTKFWSFSTELATRETPPSFSKVSRMLCDRKISCVRQGGIVVWLLSCDLAEYGIGIAPNGHDLAEHMLCKGGPAGPNKGLELVGNMAGLSVPNTLEELAELFESTWKTLKDPDTEIKEILRLANDCERLQGRKLTIMDVEHALCKLARENKLRGGK